MSILEMNVAVYCGANFGKGERYRQAAKAMGHWIAENGHTLVYGGSNTGLMGILADTVLSAGGKAIGIIPEFLLEHEQPHQDLTELFFVQDMSQRKKKMASLGEVFIALPGGPGTLEEITEVISWSRIGQNPYPCVLWNLDGYYEPLCDMYQKMTEEHFIGEDGVSDLLFTTDFQELEQFMQSYHAPKFRTYT